MDAEQVEVVFRGEEILEHAQEVAKAIEERTRKVIRRCGLAAPYGRDRVRKEALERGSVRPAK